jgi:hypothetical protein
VYCYFHITLILIFLDCAVDSKAEDDFAEIARDIFSKLHCIASARKDLVRYRYNLKQLLWNDISCCVYTFIRCVNLLREEILVINNCPDILLQVSKETGLKVYIIMKHMKTVVNLLVP